MNLQELRDAYASGQLTEPLVIDNDNVSVYVSEEVPLFESDPETLLTDALDLLDIPHEHV